MNLNSLILHQIVHLQLILHQVVHLHQASIGTLHHKLSLAWSLIHQESKENHLIIFFFSCESCKQGYYINSYDSCTSCESHCYACTSSTYCTECYSGYYLSSGNCKVKCFFNYLLFLKLSSTYTSSSSSNYYSTYCYDAYCLECLTSNK